MTFQHCTLYHAVGISQNILQNGLGILGKKVSCWYKCALPCWDILRNLEVSVALEQEKKTKQQLRIGDC